MRGIESFGMVLCASNPDHSKCELIRPPLKYIPGERIFIEGDNPRYFCLKLILLVHILLSYNPDQYVNAAPKKKNSP